MTYFIVTYCSYAISQSIDIFAKNISQDIKISKSFTRKKHTQIYFVFSGSMVKIKVGGQSCSAKKERKKIW